MHEEGVNTRNRKDVFADWKFDAAEIVPLVPTLLLWAFPLLLRSPTEKVIENTMRDNGSAFAKGIAMIYGRRVRRCRIETSNDKGLNDPG